MIEEVINVKTLRTSALLICAAVIAFVIVRETAGPRQVAVTQKIELPKPIIKLEAPVVDSTNAVLPSAREASIPQARRTTETIETKPGVLPSSSRKN